MRLKVRKIPTPKSLSNAALQYLERFAASESSLRQVLTNRIRRAAMQNPDFAANAELQNELKTAIDQLIEKYRKTGILNDAVFAETKVHSLRRMGRSRRAIFQKLKAKGVSATQIDAALETNADGAAPEEIERASAVAFLRRRKMGPFRKSAGDENVRRKELAALARAGFSLDIAKRALKTEAPEEAE